MGTQYNLLLNATDCNSIKCLRRVSADQLAKASQSTYLTGYAHGEYGFGDYYYGPYVDGEIVRQLPSQEFKEGHFTQVALLVDHDAYEGYIFSNMSETTKEEEVAGVRTLFPYAKRSFINQLFDLYPASDYNSTFFQRAKWFGDFIINCPTYYMAAAASDWGNPVYKLTFAAGTELHAAISPFTQTIALNGAYSFISSQFHFDWLTTARHVEQRYSSQYYARLVLVVRDRPGSKRSVLY